MGETPMLRQSQRCTMQPCPVCWQRVTMSIYSITLRGTRYSFTDLKDLLAKATPLRSGDELAGIAASSARERVAAQMVLADVPLERFLQEPVIPYESDEVTRLILDRHDRAAFAAVADLTVGQFREWLLEYDDHGCETGSGRAGADAGDGGGGYRNLPESGSDFDCQQVPGGQRGFAIRSACPADWRFGCSRTIRPMIPAESPRRFWMACCMAAAMRASASIRRPTMCRR